VLLTIAAVAGGALLLASAGSPRATKDGGTFRVAISGASFDSIDGALADTAGSAVLLGADCASLMRLEDKPLPEGSRVQPELASDFPRISTDGKTYVFTIRKGLRFSTGAPVTARDVAFTINRILNPALESPGQSSYASIVGAQAVIDGKAKTASGVIAKGGTLTIRLTHPVGDLNAGIASALCVLPAGLPIDPEGVKAPVPSAAPYYVSEYVPGQRVVLLRNRYYHGTRPQHVDRFVIDLTYDDNGALDAAASGKVDYAWVPNPAYAPRAPEFARRFGVNKSRFFVKPANFMRMFVLNTSRTLFRDNVPLRQAINYAIDRPALLRQFGSYFGSPTDQFLSPFVPGFRNAHVYPIYEPDLAKARALARGHTRSGRLLLYVNSRPTVLQQAEVVKHNLAKIGLDVEVKDFPGPVLFAKLANRDEPFDMAWIGWLNFEPDPRLLSDIFDGSTIGKPENLNWSYFDSPRFNRLLQAASRMTGEDRYRAYGELDVQLTRDAAPAVPYGVDNALTLVSDRAGCVIVNPYLDLATVCLK
jgi:peptide/nickel transport system substrate-binding protein